MRLANLRRPRRLAASTLALLLLLPAAGLLPAGCGGGGSDSAPADAPSAGAGRAVFSVRWPERDAASRLVPVAANSIHITLRRADATVAERLLARPEDGGVSEAAFENLPPGDLVATATAYPNTDGSGVAQASAAVPVRVQAGENSPLRLTMASTVASIEVAPSDITLVVGQSLTVTVAAKNAAGEVVLILPGTIRWAGDAPSVATVDGAGTVSGAMPGTATITATETESGTSGSSRVTVTPGAGDGCGAVAVRYAVFDLGMPIEAVSGNAVDLNDVGEAACIGTTADNKHVAYVVRAGGQVVDLSQLLPGTETEARSINGDGQVILNQGHSMVTAGRSYVWRDGTLKQLPLLPDCDRSWASGINDDGVVCGMVANIGRQIPVRWYPDEDSGYAVERLDQSLTHPFDLVWVTGINNAGQIAGHGFDQDRKLVPMYWEPEATPGGRQVLLPLPPAMTRAVTRGIGEGGSVLGDVDTPFPTPTLWRDGTPEFLPLLSDHTFGYVYALNRCGLAVGTSGTTSGPSGAGPTARAVAWVLGGNAPVDLNTRIAPDSGWVLQRAHGVNGRGHIVGIGSKGGRERGFLLLPQ